MSCSCGCFSRCSQAHGHRYIASWPASFIAVVVAVEEVTAATDLHFVAGLVVAGVLVAGLVIEFDGVMVVVDEVIGLVVVTDVVVAVIAVVVVAMAVVVGEYVDVTVEGSVRSVIITIHKSTKLLLLRYFRRWAIGDRLLELEM